jgi:uncharacterized protein
LNYTEETAYFACAGEALVGILAKPETPAEIGVVVIVGGPQYRAGSHRQFVLLSRALAQSGFAVLRFDYRGMGDSAGAPQNFEDISADIGCAIDLLQAHAPFVRQVVLWGLCDGASAALLYSDGRQDTRVAGLCLVNPWVRSAASLARTQVKHYYSQRLREKAFWAKLLSGGVAASAASGLIANLKAAFSKNRSDASARTALTFQQRMAQAWGNFNGQILLILSGDDYTAKEFLEYTRTEVAWRNLLENPQVTRRELPGADHTFSNNDARARVIAMTLGWLEGVGTDHPVAALESERAG